MQSAAATPSRVPRRTLEGPSCRATINASGDDNRLFLHEILPRCLVLHDQPCFLFRFAAESNEERDQWVRAIKDSIVENPFGEIVKDKRQSFKIVKDKREAIKSSTSTLTLTSLSTRSRTSTATFYDVDNNNEDPLPSQRNASYVSYSSAADNQAVSMCLDGTCVDNFQGYNEYLGNKNT